MDMPARQYSREYYLIFAKLRAARAKRRRRGILLLSVVGLEAMAFATLLISMARPDADRFGMEFLGFLYYLWPIHLVLVLVALGGMLAFSSQHAQCADLAAHLKLEEIPHQG